MSLIKDFNDLHIGMKGTLLNILSTVPFFFISTYMFNPELIEKIQGNALTDVDFYFLISVCLTISVLWFFMNFLVSNLADDFVNWLNSLKNQTDSTGTILENEKDSVDVENNNEEDAKYDEDSNESSDLFVITYIYSIGYLALAIFLNIWIGLSYTWFILSCFGFIVLRLLWVAIWYGLFKKLERRLNGKLDR